MRRMQTDGAGYCSRLISLLAMQWCYKQATTRFFESQVYNYGTNLLEVLRDWTLAINDKKGVKVAYIDYARAFETVSHAKLFHKLTAYGITGTLLDWIKSLLSERTQQTKIGNSVSCSTVLTSGVIQVSVLGPLLKLFRTSSIDVINDCRANFSFMLPSEMIGIRKAKFEIKFNTCNSLRYYFGL